MEQISLFQEDLFWLPREDNECRVWECPVCSCRIIGQPLGWYQFNKYKFCHYCGVRLFTHLKDVTDEDGLQ